MKKTHPFATDNELVILYGLVISEPLHGWLVWEELSMNREHTEPHFVDLDEEAIDH